MTLQEIPAGEQLMGVTSEPSVPAEMQFLVKGLIWPTPEALDRQLDTAAQADAGLLNNTIGWIDRVLRPEFIAPDLRQRLLAAREIVSGQDAFLARYRIDQTSIQIVVTLFRMHVVIVPAGSSPLAAMHTYLQMDPPGVDISNAQWQTGQIDGMTFGYQPRGSVQDWRESLYYLTKGQAVKLSLKKIARPPGSSNKIKGFVPPTEEAERHWFGVNPEPLR